MSVYTRRNVFPKGKYLFENILKKYRTTYFVDRQLTYAERIKRFQNIKEDNSLCSTLLETGKFLVYSGSKPLIAAKEDTYYREPVWLNYNDLSHTYAKAFDSSILLDVDSENNVRFSVQLGRLDEDGRKKFEEVGSKFMNLKYAFMSASWSDGGILSRANMLHMFNRNNSFCGKCGGGTQRNSAGDSRKCLPCSRSIYPASNPVGIVLIANEDNDQILLVRQPKSPPGFYTCVAGFANAGESLEDTVKREIMEEVGLEARDIQYVASQHWPFPGALMAGCYSVVSDYELNLDKNELEDGKWFTRPEVTAAVERSRKMSFAFLTNPSGAIVIPPPSTIAHQLIRHWTLKTPRDQINALIRDKKL